MRKGQESKGWVVAVEHPDGDLLYVVAAPSPADAEDIVASNLNLPNSQGVRMVAAATEKELTVFKLKDGEMRGPL